MRRIIILLLLAGLAGSSNLMGQEDVPAEEAEEEATGPKISVHGYLTQAYARSDAHQFLGINEDGTADYRTAALQIRADLSPADAFVVQLSHERFGASRIQEIKKDVELDWIFYEHRFGDSSVKVGRVQVPFGIYNEVLDVGTLLPFYRPSHNFYGEAVYSSEAVDGIVLSHSFALGNGWGLDADVHYGDCENIERDLTGRYLDASVSDSAGVELWLDTPVPGLRIGAGAMRFDLASQVLGALRAEIVHLSVAGDFDRFAVHAEAKSADVGATGKSLLGYVHLGVNLSEKLTLHAQNDFAYFKMPGASRFKADDNRGLGINYAVQPALHLKAEHHWSDSGFWLEDLPTFTTTMDEVRYWIVSLSTSF